MNWVDALIIALFIITLFRCWHAGITQLVLTFTGLLGGLVIASWLVRTIVPHFSNQLTKVFVLLLAELSLAFLFVFFAMKLSKKLNIRFINLKFRRVNDSLGSIIGGLIFLFSVWLIASVLVNVSSFGIARNVSHSYIIKNLDSTLPAPPDVFARLEKIVDPNGLPDVFLNVEPQHTTISAKNSVKGQAVISSEASMVKIQGAGCGGIVYGSGFVIAKNLVATNAHVLAGVSRPEIVDRHRSYFATPVAFDPRLDVAMLYVKNLPDPPLKIANGSLPDSSAAAILGFPAGGPLVAENVVVIDNLTAVGRDIYNAGIVSHDIYEIQGKIEPGDSGGPLLAPDGKAVGVVFGTSLSQDNIGYALSINQLQPGLNQASASRQRVSTGTCTSGIVDF